MYSIKHVNSLKISAPRPSDTIGSQLEGELNCMQQGGRLFAPRSTRAVKYFEEFENIHIGKDAMFQFAKEQSRQAIGLHFNYEIGDTDGELIYK